MQKVTILCTGKLKEKFYLDAVAEYVKRLSRFCRSSSCRRNGCRKIPPPPKSRRPSPRRPTLSGPSCPTAVW